MSIRKKLTPGNVFHTGMSPLNRTERLVLIFLLALIAAISAGRYHRFFTIQNSFPTPLESKEKTGMP